MPSAVQATAARPPQSSPTRATQAATTAALRVGLFGCPLDTGNAGVSALGLSTMLGLLRAAPNVQFTMYDYGIGERECTIELGEQQTHARLVGCYNSRRYWRTTNLTQMLYAARLGIGGLHPATRPMCGLHAILDISGGDSFADIYGPRRFNDVTLPKELAVQLGVPLVLLPQTYGPYTSPIARARAAAVVRGARQAWARDQRSYEVLCELLGSDLDSARHRSGVDVAFALPPCRPGDGSVTDRIETIITSGTTLVGLNVSGLLYNRPGDDISRYGFRTSYRALIERLTNELLALPGTALMLTPHVMPARAMVDDDSTACDDLYRTLPVDVRDRVVLLPRDWNVMELKWAIGKCAWFCGTRMHSCIGALSQGVPTAAIAYSDKTLGVFQTAGVGDCVVDPRAEDEDSLIRRIMQGYQERQVIRSTLGNALPSIRTRMDEQFRSIVEGITP